ncbi:SET domain-containing protein [Euphorbia peplus]|nr:SET domain-containing protein [Euphorbia peplus]
MAAAEEEAKLQSFLLWLQANKVELRGCNIKFCGPNKGFGIFSSNDTPDGVLIVVPLDLAITPMRVLQDPLIGPECRAMFEEGEVDDRFLMVLFLMLERLRKNSSWKPYLDMLPSTFGNPLWFTDEELLELKGTTLYRATDMQKKKLLSLYNDKVKVLVEKLLNLDGESESEVLFEDFLWANSVFWSRALNIPFPRNYVFPNVEEIQVDSQVSQEVSASVEGETLWVEGLVPGIDFCNHALKAAATWEVDGTGSVTGVPVSMFLLAAERTPFEIEKEIFISYGNKGNEELLYLYGFVIENNTHDYLMVHYPAEAIQNVAFSDSKLQLLEAQKVEMRCLLPKSLLDHGFFPVVNSKNDSGEKCKREKVCDFSWSGQRKNPSYLNKLVFPEDFLAMLRTVAMQEAELYKVSSLLEELVGTEGERQPTDSEVRAAIWEACGDSGALQLLVDLLQMKLLDLEEGSGPENCDSQLLEKAQFVESQENHERCQNNLRVNRATETEQLSKNKRACVVYRKGQKELSRLFLKEAEHALQLSLSEC